MNAPTDSIQPVQHPITDSPKGSSDYLYVVGFIALAFLLLALAYCSYRCKHYSSSSPTIFFGAPATNYTEASNRHLLGFSRGLDDDILLTFPTFLYSELSTIRDDEGDTSGCCSICLVDYKPEDVVRLLPECGHLFHVSCIGTWLKAHPTCPMCRKSPHIVGTLPLTIN